MVAVLRAEPFKLLGGLDAFSQRLEPEGTTQFDERVDQRSGIG